MSELKYCDLMRIQNARERFWKTNGGKEPTDPELMVFLLDEIDQYREKIKEAEQLEKQRANEFAKYTKETADFSESVAEAVQEMANRWETLSKRVEQLGQMIENKMDQVLGDTIETMRGINAERAADGGTMTVTNKNEAWRTIAMNLLRNGYFVCVNIDTEEQTVTIEFWRG